MKDLSFIKIGKGRTMVRKPLFSREHIHNAALELVAEKGYYGVSIPDIARSAGTATGTIYRYFDSKDALMNELFIESKQLFAKFLFSNIEPGGSFEDVFSSVWESMILFARQEPARLRFIAMHYHGSYLGKDALLVVNQLESQVQDILQVLIEAQNLNEIHVELAISIVFGSFHELFRKLGEINDENQPIFEELGRTVSRLFIT
jgi:TetR/AcrR family transcriptional regulator, repressor of fatR-cypB operon